MHFVFPPSNLLPQHVRQIALPLPNLIEPLPSPHNMYINTRAHEPNTHTHAHIDSTWRRTDWHWWGIDDGVSGNHSQERLKYVWKGSGTEGKCIFFPPRRKGRGRCVLALQTHSHRPGLFVFLYWKITTAYNAFGIRHSKRRFPNVTVKSPKPHFPSKRLDFSLFCIFTTLDNLFSDLSHCIL